MKNLLLLALAAFVLNGCATSQTHYVDSKDRDCTRTLKMYAGIYSSQTDKCEEVAGPEGNAQTQMANRSDYK